MADQTEIIAKYEKELQLIKGYLTKYEKVFEEAGLVETKEQKKIAEMHVLTEKGFSKLKVLKSKEIDVDYDALVLRLSVLKSVDFLLKEWYLDGTIKKEYKISRSVEVQYNNAFVKKKIVKADATLFIKDYDSGLLKKTMIDKYNSHKGAKALRQFFADNGGASHVDFLKKNTEACILRYTLFEEMEALKITGEEGVRHYNNVLSPNRAALLTTDAEINTVKEWKTTLDTFITKYDALTDNLIRKLLKAIYDNYVSIVADIPNKLKLLEDAKVKALKKDAYASKLAGMSEEEQIKSNPDIGTEAGSYIEKGKEPKPGKESKVDKGNQKVLKGEGAYDKENGYDMYDKGDGDVDEVDINDVKQGALGDCYLISAIAGVAKDNPSYIKKLITYKDKETFATVKLYIRNSDGTRTAKTVKVDFYFPVSGVKAAFAKAGDGELWVMVLEKAYAKLMGGYDNIGKGGDPAEALSVLTGNEAVVKEMSTDDATLGTDLASVVVKGKSSVAGTKQNTEIPSTYTVTEVTPGQADGFKVTLPSGNHIFCSHAYTVTEVDETAKKVKLRNPHGGSSANLEITFKEFRDCFTNFKVVDVPV